MSNMVVRTNIFSLNAHRNMKNVGLEQQRASNRLSSGFRINSAADDAAGLAISESMRAQIRGLDQASRNVQDGQAMVTVTEGGLDEMSSILQRVRELLVQASNDTNTNQQRRMIDSEISQLATELYEMRGRVEFNENRVLQIGEWTIGVPNFEGQASTIGPEFASFINGTVRADIANAVETVTEGRGVGTTTLVTGRPGNLDNTLAWFQAGANSSQGITFDFARVSGISLLAARVVEGVSEVMGGLVTHEASGAGGAETVAGIGFGAQISLMVDELQAVMNGLNMVRAELGAVINRMDHTMRNLDLSSENLQDAESRVRNADIAREMMRFTMQNVLQQAATSMLAQANQLPQNLLQLLR